MDDAENQAQVPTEPLLEQPPIVDVSTLNQNLPDEYIAQKVADEEGGTGKQYKVDISSYSAFKADVINKGFDIDDHYGWQCWDGNALLWQQLGLSLVTGNGLAIGCWDLKRNVNKYDKFDLITDVNSLKLGDTVVMRPNHIGYFDGYDGAYMRILGQNQGGTPGPNGGMAFNLARITKSAFAGAFRYKAWQKPSIKRTKIETWKTKRNYVLTEDTYIRDIPSNKKAGTVLHKKGEVLDIGEYTEWSNGNRSYRTKVQVKEKDQRGYGRSMTIRAEIANIKSVTFK